jgi:hypothetical protein
MANEPPHPAQPTLWAHLLTGAAGLALALWRAGNLQRRQDWLEAAQQLAGSALNDANSRPSCYVQESLLDGMQHAAELAPPAAECC